MTSSQIRIVISLLLWIIVADSSGQVLLSGSVRDSGTREPLIGAVIKNTSGNGSASDLDGNFKLEILGAGDSLYVTFLGYRDALIQVTAKHLAEGCEVLLNPVSSELGVVVISAGRFEQDISEVTVSMEVVRPEMIRDKNIVSADEALQQTPGVSIVDKEPQIRGGSGYSFGAGSRVQILVDDMPSLSGDAGRPSWDYLPVENISQIEVIKGASSVLYGSAALSGVINVRTAYPVDTPRTVVNVYHGVFSHPQNDSSVYWNGNLMRSGINFLHSRKIRRSDLVISANIIGDDGHLGPIIDTASRNFTNGYNPFTVDRYNANSRARLSANYRIRSKKFSGLSFGVNTNWNISNSLGTLLWANADTGLYAAYEGSATRTNQLLFTIDPFITYFNQRGDRHTLRTRWQSLDNNNDNNQGNFSDQYYAEYQYQHNWAAQGVEDFTTTFGLVTMLTDARGELFSGGNSDGRNSADNYAGFFQADKKLFGKLNISAGVRYEYFQINNASDSKPVFRAGLNYRLARATYARASFGQGYRFPSIAEKFIVTGVGSINIFANPDLVAETSSNAELGLRQGFRIGRFYGFADFAVFHQEYNNFIEFTFGQWQRVPSLQEVGFNTALWSELLGNSIGFKSVNTGKARIQGAEISVMGEGKIGDVELQLLSGYTYTLPVSLTPDQSYGTPPNGEFEELKVPAQYTYKTTSSDSTNNILKYRMQHLVRVDLSAKWRSWMLGLSARYNSHMQNIDRAFEDLETVSVANFQPGITSWRKENTDGDYVIDLRFGYTFKSKHRLSIAVNNLLNREYSIRPLAIEEPRLTTLQYSISF
jgi:outer membrane receptor protein involved in Fe transport